MFKTLGGVISWTQYKLQRIDLVYYHTAMYS